MKKCLFIFAGIFLLVFASAQERKNITFNGESIWVQKVRNEVREYDSEGNLSYEKVTNKEVNEYWYNPAGKIIHARDNSGYESWAEYDSNGHELHYKNTRGTENWYEYDAKGNEIYSKETSLKDLNSKEKKCEETWAKYDDHGNVIFFKRSDGLKRTTKYQYDDHGNMTYMKEGDNRAITFEYDYNENGTIIHSVCNDGTETWFNAAGKKIHEISYFFSFEDSHDTEAFFDYDSKGRLVHLKVTRGKVPFEEWDFFNDQDKMIRWTRTTGSVEEYDENGNMTHYRHEDGSEDFCENDYNNKNQLVKVTYYEKIFLPETYTRTTCRLKLRATEDLSSKVLTIMRDGTYVEPLETGKTDTIDGITSPWLKVRVFENTEDIDDISIGGFEGWCFGGYLDGSSTENP